MSKRNYTVALRHMLDHAREAVQLAQGKSRADLDTDRLLNIALVLSAREMSPRERKSYGKQKK